MLSFIFVSIICIGDHCEFLASSLPISEERCLRMKTVFLETPLKNEVTLAAAQCMRFNHQIGYKPREW
jgi:hypothetical protein